MLALVAAGAAVATDITSPEGPLTLIRTTPDLNCAVNHIDDSHGEFFGDTACATLVAVGSVLYGPGSIPAGSRATPRTPFVPVSQSALGGAGSESNPYKVETVVDAGPLRLTQTDSYVTGFGSFRTDVRVFNKTDAPVSAIIYRAGDCYLQNSDVGYGAVQGGSVACRGTGPDGTPGPRVEQWTPLTAESTHYEAGYAEVWEWIGSRRLFPDTCRCDTSLDNGAGLSWPLNLPAQTSLRVSHLLSFSPAGSQADTDNENGVRVAILGDSYIAGVGGVDTNEAYEPGSDTGDNTCRRSKNSWAYKISQRLEATDTLFAACNGAKSPDVLSRGQMPTSPDNKKQLKQLEDWMADGAADIVFLSIGGNDVGFSNVIAECMALACRDLLRLNELVAAGERSQLRTTYGAVKDLIRQRNPSAELWVSTYPISIDGHECAELGVPAGVTLPDPYLFVEAGVSGAEQAGLRDRFIKVLNQSVRAAADEVGANVLDLEDMFEGHAICGPAESYTHGLVAGGDVGLGPLRVLSSKSFHPTKRGYSHIDDEVWERYQLQFGEALRTPLGGNGEIGLLAAEPVNLFEAPSVRNY